MTSSRRALARSPEGAVEDAVVDAQRALHLARRDYAQSRYEYLINRLKLKQAAGTLSETDLVGISSALR